MQSRKSIIGEVDLNLIDLNSLAIQSLQSYIIFGAGCAGTSIAWFLQNIRKSEKFAFCDNDVSKQNDKATFPVYSVEETFIHKNAIYLIGFMDNNKYKLESAVACLMDKGVSDDRIILIDMHSGWFDDTCETYTKSYIKALFQNRNEVEKIDRVDKICFLANGFSKEVENKASGGSIGAICMQKKYLGDKYDGIAIEYPYYVYSTENVMTFNKYWYITGTIDAVYKFTKKECNAIYIANDMFSAFALYILGKKYCLIFHGQGDIVQEWTLWGRNLSEKEIEMIHEIEYVTIKNACNVSFPSIGAKWYFKQSLNKSVDFNCGLPLYNTIYDFPTMEKVVDLKRDESKITFLSIGQFTWLKGIDRIPDFIEQYILNTGKTVRWIVVADGVLKKEVKQRIELLKQREKLDYINIDYKISHAQIFYLMNICDIYLMLHRVSIFDFSTLEAMYCGKAVILSDIPGNDEYNKENNIMLVNDNTEWNILCNYIDNNVYYGVVNKRIYKQYFSDSAFVQRYNSLFNKFIASVESK